MSACNAEVIKLIGKYYNVPVGTVCYNTDKVLTTYLANQSIEGFATIVLKLAANARVNLSQEQILLSYQWLEHISMYANQAAANPAFAQGFLRDINKALERNTYLAGQSLTVTDVAAYYVLYPLIDRLSVSERESLMHLCRWTKHVQVQPRVCTNQPPLTINTLNLSILAPACLPPTSTRFPPLPKQILPHQLKNTSLDGPVVYYPQPYSYPGYPIVLYL